MTLLSQNGITKTSQHGIFKEEIKTEEMKTCAKCGQNVNIGTSSCPNCDSFAFHTENGMEGGIAELLQMLMFKNQKAFWIIATILGIIVFGAAIYFYVAFLP